MKKLIILIVLVLVGWFAYSYNSKCISTGAKGGILTTKGLYCHYYAGQSITLSKLSVLIEAQKYREWMEVCVKKNPTKRYLCTPQNMNRLPNTVNG